MTTLPNARCRQGKRRSSSSGYRNDGGTTHPASIQPGVFGVVSTPRVISGQAKARWVLNAQLERLALGGAGFRTFS
jgi:hypothetical protein